jgi:FAD:protein FMN transferase
MEFDALGTHWWIEPLDDSIFSDTVQKKVLSRVHTFENDYSRFKPTSILSKLNKDLESAGYGQKIYGTKLSHDLVRDLKISRGKITVQKDMSIDLGGLGKGWLIDKLVELLKRESHHEFLINGGGDIFVSSVDKQECYIEHPKDNKQVIGSVLICNRGFASSAAQKRVWQVNGKNHHHIIDPASGLSNSTLASVHVLASTALLADVLCTVFLLVDHLERLRLAQLFEVDFMAVNCDLTYFTTDGFRLVTS